MAYTFDGPNKLIILSSGTTVLDVKDMYSRWKDWVATSDNAKYLPALAVLGGDPLPGGRYLGTTYFIENGWKVRPYEGNHQLVVSGNMYARDGSDPFVNTLGSYNVRIMLTVSNLIDTITTGGGVGTVAEVANAVWDATQSSHTASGTMGAALAAAGTAGDPWIADLSSYVTSGTAGKILKDAGVDITTIKTNTDTVESSLTTVQADLTTIKGYTDTLESSVGAIKAVTDTMPSAANIATAVRAELTPELTQIMQIPTSGALTTQQANMLLALYDMMGLDPAKPLVVTNTSRSAGAISQSITSDTSQTIVQRV